MITISAVLLVVAATRPAEPASRSQRRAPTPTPQSRVIASPAGPGAQPTGSAGVAETMVASGVFARALMPRGIGVRVEPRADESWATMARRLTGHFANAGVLRGRESSRYPKQGQRYEIPFELLLPGLQQETVAAILPLDHCEGSYWVHLPQAGFAPDASPRQLAAWFSAGSEGEAALAVQLGAATTPRNGEIRIPCVGIAPWLSDARGCCATLSADEEQDRAEATLDAPGGDLLLQPMVPTRPPIMAERETAAAPSPPQQGAPGLPGDLLPGPRASTTPARPVQDAAPAVAASAVPDGSSLLTYGRDERGEFAVYRLRPGEAVYSSVVVRFTGRVHARDVNELIPIIADRSGVRSFQDLPVGFEIHIPVELLAPEFLPRSDARRQGFEKAQAAVASLRNREVAQGLAGVAVLLDPGHGGRDRGAMSDDVWESDYVYDVMCRIKRKLEKTTRARVIPLLRNATLDYLVRDRKRLQPLADTDVQTHPPYRLEDPVVGVNLRWYLASNVYRRLLKEGYPPSRIVFTSIHADSLHPSVRGAMVYVPAAAHTAGRYGRRGPEYDSRREPREEGYFSFSERERTLAEGLSTDLAKRILGQFAANNLPVHDVNPIRGSVLRNGREWLPAVLRSNPVPVRVLLEVVNLNHLDDNRLLELPAFRERVAEAYVTGLLEYYGGGRAVPGKR